MAIDIQTLIQAQDSQLTLSGASSSHASRIFINIKAAALGQPVTYTPAMLDEDRAKVVAALAAADALRAKLPVP